MAKKKNKVTEVVTFASVQEAKAAKEKAQKKVERIKTRFPFAIAAQCGCLVFLLGMGLMANIMPDNMSDDLFAKLFGGLFVIWIGLVATGLIATGGVGSALSNAWGICKKIGWIGWFMVPFPIDIVTGIMLSVIGFMFFVYALLLAPMYFINRNKKENEAVIAAADQYLQAAGV